MSGELRDAMRRTEERKQAAGLPQVSQLEGDDFMAMVRRIFVGLDLDIEEVLELSAEQRARAMGTVMLSGLGPGLLGAAFWLEGLLAGLLLMDARNLEIDGGGGDHVPSIAGSGNRGVSAEDWARVPEQLRQQAEARGFNLSTIDRFEWATDPFGNDYVTAYEVTSRHPEPKLHNFRG